MNRIAQIAFGHFKVGDVQKSVLHALGEDGAVYALVEPASAPPGVKGAGNPGAASQESLPLSKATLYWHRLPALPEATPARKPGIPGVAEVKSATLDEVKAACSKRGNSGTNGWGIVSSILKRHFGVDKADDLKPEQYAEAVHVILSSPS